jgi:hypothetical protein
MKLAALLALTLGCSTLGTYIKPVESCAGKSVSAADAQEALNDLLTQNYADLAVEGVRLGYDVLACVISSLETQAPGLKPSADAFRSLHAPEFRAAGVR